MKKKILDNFDNTEKLHTSANHFFGFNRIMGIQKPEVSKIELPTQKVADVAREAIASKKRTVQQRLKVYDHKPGHILDIKG